MFKGFNNYDNKSVDTKSFAKATTEDAMECYEQCGSLKHSLKLRFINLFA